MKTVLICASPYIKNVQVDAKDIVICVDKGLEYARQNNLPVDLVVGDFDSLKSDIYKEYPHIKLNPVKDETDFYVALQAAKKYKLPIYVYGITGGRLDHFISALNYLDLGDIYYIDDYNKIYLRKGKFYIKKEYKYFSFFAFKKATYITIEKAKYPLDNYLLQPNDSLCVSNETDDVATITTSDFVIVVESN